jgi:hypothetical protein
MGGPTADGERAERRPSAERKVSRAEADHGGDDQAKQRS